MSLFDLTQRAEAVLKKYEKYDAPLKPDKVKTDDPFMEEYYEVEEEVEKLIEAAGEVAIEDSRSAIAQKNAEIRRAKQVLLTEAVEALQRKVKKGKRVSKTLIQERQRKIQEIIDKIYAIPDGMSSNNRRPMRMGAKGSKKDPIILDSTGHGGSRAGQQGFHDHTEATQAFDKEWERAKERQDKQLDIIGEGVDRLGEIARNMHEEVDRQNPVIDDIEAQMDKVTGQLKNNNMKLKGLVTKMRSSRNFCVDIVLICIILAIGAYIYSMFKD